MHRNGYYEARQNLYEADLTAGDAPDVYGLQQQYHGHEHVEPSSRQGPCMATGPGQQLPLPQPRLQLSHQPMYAEYEQAMPAGPPSSSPYGMPAPQQHMPAAPAPYLSEDTLKSLKDMPTPFHQLYSYRYFNPVQSECFDVAYHSDTNMVVSAPTGAGKTGVMELAVLRLLSKHLTAVVAAHNSNPHPQRQQQQQVLQALRGSSKTVYIGPIKALVQERQADWQRRFGMLGLRCVQLTGDVDDENMADELEAADIICTTPEKFDQVTRTVFEKGNPGFITEIALVLVDEVHLLSEAGRGSSLEAGCICRLKAIAALPDMAKAPLGSVRFVAVSATIPNIADLAKWLQVPAQGLRQYGDELRPCKLTTHVKGYNPAKNDFLFERRLNEYVFGIVRDYSNGRPALLFCNSRKGTMDTALMLVKGAEAAASAQGTPPGATGTGSAFVKSQAQLQRLQAAAARTQAKALAVALSAGVGFHNAAMEPGDRELVEGLFKSNDLAVLCTTSTLAMGVNLPAHLVILKGTTRYAGEAEAGPGEAAGYKEYTQTEVLQMVGRAGRPQFDTEGVAVIMTCRDSINRYKKLLAGQPVESCLMSNLAEHMNAEVVLGTIKDVPGAIQWIKSSFLFTRVRSNPQHYGLKVRPGMTEAELEGLLRDELVLKPVGQLMRYGLLATDEDSYSLQATGPGRLMANHFLKLNTMAAIVSLGQRPNMPSLLRVICGAEEFRGSSLRRCERKALNDLNHANDTLALRYPVMATNDDGSSTGKVKQRITSAQEKLFILLNDGLADKPADSLDYSLKQEQDRLLVVGQRIAKCMARYYVLQNSFSAAGRSLLLTRSLRVRLWDDSSAAVRQLPSVGKLLGARLAAAGLGSLKALAACNDAHQIEVAAQKPYPWGSELLAHLRAISPPPVTMQLQVLQVLPNRALNCQLTLTRADTHSNAAVRSSHQTTITAAWGTAGAAAAPLAAGTAGQAGSAAAAVAAAMPAAAERKIYSSFTPCKLLCGCSSTDQLLLMRSMVLETFESPMQLHFKVDPPADASQPVNLAARLVLDRVVGLDEKASLQVPATCLTVRHGAGAAASVQSQAAGALHDADEPAAAEHHDQRHGSFAAAAKPQHTLLAKRTFGGSVTAGDGGVPEGAAAAKQLCGPARQHQTHAPAAGAGAAGMQQGRQHLQQLWGSMQLQQNGTLQDSTAAAAQELPVGSHSIMGALAPGQQQQQHAAPASSRQESSEGPTAQAGPPVSTAPLPNTSIAVRYHSMLQSSGCRRANDADSASRTQQQQPPSGCGAGLAAVTASADDASRLQVTPEPMKQQHQQRQEDKQQQPAPEPGQGSSACEEPQQEHLFAGGPSNIASLFDMLAEDLACEEEQQQQQQQQAAQLRSAAANSALQAATQLPCPASRQTPAAGSLQACSEMSNAVTHTRATPSPTSVFEAAVLEKHQASLSQVSQPTSSTSSRTLAQHGCAAVRPVGVLKSQLLGLRSQPAPLRHGSMLAANSSSRALQLRNQQDEQLESGLPPPPPQQQQQQPLARHIAPDLGQRQLQQVQLVPAVAAAVAGGGAKGDAEGFTTTAEGGYGGVGGELMTPPRQLLRTSTAGTGADPHTGGTAEAAGSSMRQGRASSSSTAVRGIAQRQQQYSTGMGWQEAHGGLLASGLQYAAEDEEGQVEQHVSAVPDLQQFAFGAVSQSPAAPAVFKPSQDSLMFQRSSQSSASSRALAQARLASKPGSATTSNRSSFTSALAGRLSSTYQPLQGSSVSSGAANAAQVAQCALPMAPPAPRARGPGAQWGSFVTHSQRTQQQQQQSLQLHDVFDVESAAAASSFSAEPRLGQQEATDLAGSYCNSLQDTERHQEHLQQQQHQQAARHAARAAWQPPAGGPSRHLLLGSRGAHSVCRGSATSMGTRNNNASWVGVPGAVAGLSASGRQQQRPSMMAVQQQQQLETPGRLQQSASCFTGEAAGALLAVNHDGEQQDQLLARGDQPTAQTMGVAITTSNAPLGHYQQALTKASSTVPLVMQPAGAATAGLGQQLQPSAPAAPSAGCAPSQAVATAVDGEASGVVFDGIFDFMM